MKRFIDGVDRSQTTLFRDRLEEGIDDGNPVRAIDVFVDALELLELGFERVAPKRLGRMVEGVRGRPGGVTRRGRRHRVMVGVAPLNEPFALAVGEDRTSVV